MKQKEQEKERRKRKYEPYLGSNEPAKKVRRESLSLKLKLVVRSLLVSSKDLLWSIGRSHRFASFFQAKYTPTVAPKVTDINELMKLAQKNAENKSFGALVNPLRELERRQPAAVEERLLTQAEKKRQLEEQEAFAKRRDISSIPRIPKVGQTSDSQKSNKHKSKPDKESSRKESSKSSKEKEKEREKEKEKEKDKEKSASKEKNSTVSSSNHGSSSGSGSGSSNSTSSKDKHDKHKEKKHSSDKDRPRSSQNGSHVSKSNGECHNFLRDFSFSSLLTECGKFNCTSHMTSSQ